MSSSRELAENKLILLYLIDKIGIPVSNLHITRIILENNYMNYFMLQQYLNELISDKLLGVNLLDGKELYSIASSGKQTLTYFAGLVPAGIKKTIDNTAIAMRKSIKNETHITADYSTGNNNDFTVICKVNEDDFSLIDLHITVGTSNDARTICENWKRYSHLIYPEIIQSLIKKRD